MEEWRKKLINEGDKKQAFDYIEYLEGELMKHKEEELKKAYGVTDVELEEALNILHKPIEVGNARLKYFDADNYTKLEQALQKSITLFSCYEHLLNIEDEYRLIIEFIKEKGLYQELLDNNKLKDWEKEDVKFYELDEEEQKEYRESIGWWQRRYNSLNDNYSKLNKKYEELKASVELFGGEE